MSADNWTECPRCEAKRAAKIEGLRKKLEESYGKVPVDKYREIEADLAKAVAETSESHEEELREDYSLGVDDGMFHVNYRADCQNCDFTFVFAHEVDAKVAKGSL